jgi:hypothetical protein
MLKLTIDKFFPPPQKYAHQLEAPSKFPFLHYPDDKNLW